LLVFLKGVFLAWFKKGSFWVTKTIEELPSFL